MSPFQYMASLQSEPETVLSPYQASLHVPFLCLQYGFNLVMSHPHAVNEIALSLNNKNPR